MTDGKNTKRVEVRKSEFQVRTIEIKFPSKNQGTMVWERKCWSCGTILKKEDPQTIVICECTWEWI